MYATVWVAAFVRNDVNILKSLHLHITTLVIANSLKDSWHNARPYHVKNKTNQNTAITNGRSNLKVDIGHLCYFQLYERQSFSFQNKLFTMYVLYNNINYMFQVWNNNKTLMKYRSHNQDTFKIILTNTTEKTEYKRLTCLKNINFKSRNTELQNRIELVRRMSGYLIII